MVEVREVPVTDLQEEDTDSQYEDIGPSDNLLEDDDDFILDESLLDRFSALVDIIPPKTRAYLSTFSSDCVAVAGTVSGFVGSGLWIFATASLLVLLPVSLELERDAMAIQQDYQMQQNSQV